jgi:hypothetical protein
MVNHPNRSVLSKDFPPEVLERLENLVTDMEMNLVNVLGGYQRDTKDRLYNAFEAAIGALGDVRAIIQKRRAGIA